MVVLSTTFDLNVSGKRFCLLNKEELKLFGTRGGQVIFYQTPILIQNLVLAKLFEPRGANTNVDPYSCWDDYLPDSALSNISCSFST